MKQLIEGYGIRKKGSKMPLTFYILSNEGGDFCGEFEYCLSPDHVEDDPIWMCDSEESAKWVLNNSTAWYNAEEERPSHSLEGKEDNYEIVKIIKTLEVEPV